MSTRRNVKAAVIGMVLGDGCLYQRHANAQFQTSSKHEDYLRFKLSIVEEITSGWVSHHESLLGKWWSFQTKVHPLFTDLRMRFYHQGRKTVDKHLISCLDERGLALWYMDDGSWQQDTLTVRFSTDCFNEAEHDVMANGLWKRFGLRFNVNHWWRKREGKRILGLTLRAADRAKFFALVSPTVSHVSSMLYKIPTAEGMERLQALQTRLDRMDELDALLTDQVLTDLFTHQGMGIGEIGTLLGVSNGSVAWRLEKLGLYSPLRRTPNPDIIHLSESQGDGQKCSIH